MAKQRQQKSPEQIWWEEDAQRLNDLGERMRRSGVQVSLTEDELDPPELNDDGSLTLIDEEEE